MIKLLYIEDKPSDQKIFQELVRSSEIDAELWLNSDIASAEEIIKNQELDLIFCDYNLKKETALDLLAKENVIDGIPVIVLSDKGNVNNTRDAFKQGAYDFFDKGDLNVKCFEDVVNSALRSKREEKLRADLEKRLDSIYSNTRTILDNTTDGIWSLDETGKLLIMNSVAKDNIKENSEKCPSIGEMFFENIDGIFKEQWEAIFQRVLKGEEILEVSKYFDGEHTFYLEMACAPIMSAEDIVGASFVARNVTERESAEEKVRESERNFRSVFTGSEVPIMLLSMKEKKIVDMNDACANMHGYSVEKMIGLSIFDTIPADLHEKYQSDLEKYLHGRISILDTFSKTIDNRRIPVQATVTEIFYNEQPCYLVFLTDISTRLETERKLNEARELAEKSAEFKSLFLANMSHEIRTPMNAMLGFADLLKKTILNEDQKEYVDIISNSGHDLLVIINDILDLTKIEAGKLELRPKSFVLVEMVNKVIRLHKEKAKEKGIHLKLEVDGNLPDEVFMDDVRLSQIMNNLVSNAIKFTETGEVKIKIAFRASSRGNWLILTVKDSGIGIPKNDLETIFENFNQVDSSLQRKQRGTGLGLSIVSQLCELMGGDITARSEVDEGSEFIVQLPIIEADEEIVVEMTETEKKELISDELRILICEDNPINVKLATKILDELGIVYDVVANGKLGVEFVQEKEPDVIFMDLQMPVMDGYEATRAIRKFSDVPIIAMSAHVLEEEQNKCIEAGMNGFIPKPFQTDDIIFELQKQFSFNEKKAAAQVKDKWKLLNMPGLTNLAKGDEEFAISLFDIFMEQAGEDLKKFKEAFSKKDQENMAGVAHRLLPSFMMFDLVQLHILAEKIEDGNASENECQIFIEKLEGSINEISEKRSSFIQSN